MSEIGISDIIKRLEYYRNSLELSQTEFARRLGMSRTAYCEIEGEIHGISYNVLAKCYSIDIDIDQFYSGKQQSLKNGIIHSVLQSYDKTMVWNVYRLIILAFLDLWDWNEDNQWEKCLHSELEVMWCIMEINQKPNERLRSLRQKLNIRQVDMADYMKIGRSKYNRCEMKQSKLDAEMMAGLYNKGLCLPSFFFEKYVGIPEIEYLLDEDVSIKEAVYQYILTIVTYINKNERAREILENLVHEK